VVEISKKLGYQVFLKKFVAEFPELDYVSESDSQDEDDLSGKGDNDDDENDFTDEDSDADETGEEVDVVQVYQPKSRIEILNK
jgi:hypothetical protein